jgi:hypothetical protein
VWADNDHDGRADGYYQNGQYYPGAPTSAAPMPMPAPAPAARGERG